MFKLLKKTFLDTSFNALFLATILLVGISSCLAQTNDYGESLGIAFEQQVAQNQINQQARFYVGTNLLNVADWSTEMPFIDAFKSARPWITQCLPNEAGCSGVWDTREYNQLNLDEFGWVKSLPSPEATPEYTRVATLMFRNVSNYLGGKYVVTYDGEGTIEYGYDARKDEVASVRGRDIIAVTPSDKGIYLIITATDPNGTGDYIRNIHVVPEEYENSYQEKIFNSEFVEKIHTFSDLRFMDWMATNNSSQSEWSNRPKPEQYSYHHSLGGVPLEVMVKLANCVDSNPWFNMPHMATDEYMHEFSKLVKNTLKPDLQVYVEYSNEVWNTQFQQGAWIENQAKQEWQSNDKSPYAQRMHWHGKRTAQMCEIWDQEFGSQSNRVICALGSQAANPWTATQGLQCPSWSEAPCQDHGIDAVAIAPYFGSYLGKKKSAPEVETWNLDKLFAELNQGGILTESPNGGAIQKAMDNIENNRLVTEDKKLLLLAYEGGQHLVGSGGVEDNSKVTDLFIAANRDSRMYNTYLNYLNKLEKSGINLFNNWLDIGAYSKWGSWGALEHLNQEKSPKYNALMDFISKIKTS